MGALAQAKAALLFLLLEPELLLTQEHGGATEEPVPGLNVTFDARRRELSWDCQANVTAVQCTMYTEDDYVSFKPKEQCRCSFRDKILHRGALLRLVVSVGQRAVTRDVVFTNRGGEDTAARNVSCFVYDADFMNCTWAQGTSAPGDTQYFLFVQDLKTGAETECPRYLDASGTHVGCHLEGASRLFSSVYVLVTGSSRETGIRFFDTIYSLKKIERYSPPRNITVHCRTAHCVIQWEKPRTRRTLSDLEFTYELDIQRRSNVGRRDSQPVEVSGFEENRYVFPSPQPRVRHTVRVRAADGRLRSWSSWSRAVEFGGSGEQAPSQVHIYVLAVLGTLTCVLVLGFLFKRSVQKPVPRINDIVNRISLPGDEQDVCTKGTAAAQGDDEEVLTVQEVGERT